MQNLLIVDGHNYLFKSFAVPFKYYSKKGTPLHVVTTFLSLIRKAYQASESPKNLIVVFDAEGKNTNNLLTPDYKANRIQDYSQIIDSPFTHLPLIKTALDNLKISWIEKQGFEGDDVISTIATKFIKSTGGQAVIASNDSDFYQLLTDDNLKILQIKRKECIMLDKQWFQKNFEFNPDKYVEYKSYIGDKTDNIRGIKGVGSIRAQEIILGKRKIQLGNAEHDLLSLNKKLIELNTKIPLDKLNLEIELQFFQKKNIELFDLCNF